MLLHLRSCFTTNTFRQPPFLYARDGVFGGRMRNYVAENLQDRLIAEWILCFAAVRITHRVATCQSKTSSIEKTTCFSKCFSSAGATTAGLVPQMNASASSI